MSNTDVDTVCFNISAFIAALFLLEFGADRFIDNTAVVALRLGVSQTLVALLTAGAEWEELAVVVASLLLQKSPLALGNVLGSSISNILGAFSLGLLFHSTDGAITFDRSAKIYTSILFVLTTVIAVLGLLRLLGGIWGVVLITSFALYVLSIGFAIYRGVVAPPEGSDSEPDSDDESDPNTDNDDVATEGVPAEDTVLLPPRETFASPRGRSLVYHTSQLLLGFLALSISGYVLSHTAASLADSFNLSGTVVGLTILAFATTLPEKFVAVISSARGHSGILVANTAGSNIFLLTLCLGLTYVVGDDDELAGALEPFELIVTWTASALLFGVVWIGSRRWVGAVLLGLYVAFIVLEFTLYRR